MSAVMKRIVLDDLQGDAILLLHALCMQAMAASNVRLRKLCVSECNTFMMQTL